ncbi:alpha/beta hydrolase [Streptomyces sp. NPDC007907]|uniref:alpha/beta hydrolase n=1 Tax=Streptomyces sp. NPDC007907 TaxID=3364789 RepID=UPI0036E59CA3
MHVFIMVAGAFTGTHVWQETAARLVAAGGTAQVVPLTDLDPDRSATAPHVGLETHIEDVLAAIDAVDATSGRQIVLVGHDYGIHPVLGAADRRAERIARVVCLDSGMPQNGVPALAAVPDQVLRAQLAERAEAGEREGVLAPPALEEWERWGSTDGVGEADLARLTALAVPQPLGTLFQPLRLTGAVAAIPVTGVLCTRNGASIDMLQRLVDFGDPALAVLTQPQVTFFELPTGHWPMLSCPGALAEVLLQAAAGDGHRLRPAGDDASTPAHLRPFPVDVPELPRDRQGPVDLYVPEGEGPRPAVVFVHGGPVPEGARPSPREWPTLMGHARLAAAEGMVGVSLEHGLHDVADYERAAADIAAGVDRVRADPRVDPDRVALWFFSGSGPLTADWLAQPPAWLRCLAASYPVLAPLPAWGMAGSRFHPARAIRQAGSLPVVVLRAGLESPEIAATVDAFVTAADECAARLELVDVPNGHHGFETIDPPEETVPAVRRVMRSVVTHLTG